MGKTGEERRSFAVSHDHLERLLNLVGGWSVIEAASNNACARWISWRCRVLANKNRLTDAVRHSRTKHTFSFQPSPCLLKVRCLLMCRASAIFRQPGVRPVRRFQHFGPPHQRDCRYLRIDGATVGVDPSPQDDMGSLQQLTLGMRDEFSCSHGADRNPVCPSSGVPLRK